MHSPVNFPVAKWTIICRRKLWETIKSLGEIQVGKAHCSPHINQVSYFLLEGNQICKVRFVFGESVLDFPTHMLHFTRDNPQEDFLHNFPRNWSKIDGPIISWFLLQPILAGGGDISIPGFWDTAQSPQLLKCCEDRSRNDPAIPLNTFRWITSVPIVL